MNHCVSGDMVIVAFPFAGGDVKRRPALVVVDTGDTDILLARVTSQIRFDRFDVTVRHWKDAGLLLPSVIRIDKLAILEKRLMERKLGSLHKSDAAAVTEALRRLLSLWENG